MISREKAMDLIKPLLDQRRMAHTLGVEGCAITLAGLYGIEAEKASVAALLHDMFRCYSDEKLLLLAETWAMPVDPYERDSPRLLHGPAAACWLSREGVVNEPDILRAIAHHTIGCPGMSGLEMLIYTADAIEPTRQYPGVEALRAIAPQSLERVTLAALEHSISHLTERGIEPHPRQMQAMEWLKQTIGEDFI